MIEHKNIDNTTTNEASNPQPKRAVWMVLRVGILPMAIYSAILSFALGSTVQKSFVKGAANATDLLKGCLSYAVLECALTAIIGAACIGWIAISLMKTVRSAQYKPKKQILVILCGAAAGIYIGISAGPILREDLQVIPTLYEEYQQARSGNWKTAEVFLYPPKSRGVAEYFIIGDNTGVFTSYIVANAAGNASQLQGAYIYIPSFITLEPDEKQYYQENRSAEWNENNSAKYEVVCTPKLQVVESIRLIQE